MSGAVRRRRTALKGELGGELAALLDAGRKLRGELEAPPLRPGELPRLPEPRVPSYHLTGERARLAREADYRRGLRREAIGERVQLDKQRRASTRATDVATLEAEAFKEEREHVKGRGRELVEEARERLRRAEAEWKAQIARDGRDRDRERERAKKLPRAAKAGEWLSIELGNIPAELHAIARRELPRIRAELRERGNTRVAPWERFLEDFEAGSYEHHAHAPRVTDRELAREAERYHMERELELAERAGELGQALEDLDDEQAAELLAELDDDDPPF